MVMLIELQRKLAGLKKRNDKEMYAMRAENSKVKRWLEETEGEQIQP